MIAGWIRFGSGNTTGSTNQLSKKLRILLQKKQVWDVLQYYVIK